MEKLPKNETISLRNKYIGKSCQLFFREDPLKIVRAEGQYMYDEKDEAFLDCINNVAHVGHCHPKVIEAGYKQMKLLCTNNRFLHDNIVLYAKRLIEIMPKKLNRCFFVNSGSEANDLAIRLAQIHTGNKDIITLEGAYHGHLTSLIDISHYKFSLPGGVGLKDHVHLASSPDRYRGKYNTRNNDENSLAQLYAEEIKEICEKIKENKSGVCAFIAESLLSCGGQIIPPKNYLKEVYKHVRANGGVCIADEVQVGFGRVGTNWWAFELQDVIPDIVTIGKPMGNGHPVAAVITTEEIQESFYKTGVEYFNTYGGNAVSCAIANAVLDVIIDENLMENAISTGNYLLKQCEKLKNKFKQTIGDVRGKGLFLGIEIVKNPIERIPDPETAYFIYKEMRRKNILLSVDGPERNVIKMKPPMVFSKENVDTVVNELENVLKILEKKGHQKNGYV